MWVTTSWTLWHDSSRDLRDLGAAHIPLKSLETTDLSQLHSFKEGVLFVTYKYLTKQSKCAKCSVCDSALIEALDPSATCHVCKKEEAKVAWICPEDCKECSSCDQCHQLLLVSRVKAVSDWMNGGTGNGDGVLVLDESHSAKISTTVTHLGVCLTWRV